MKIINQIDLEKNYDVVENVELVNVLVAGKPDKRARRSKFTAVVNKAGSNTPLLTKTRGYIVFDPKENVYVSKFYPVQDYAGAKNAAKELAAVNERDYLLHTIYATNAERIVKGTASYIEMETPAVYEEVYVVPKPIKVDKLVLVSDVDGEEENEDDLTD